MNTVYERRLKLHWSISRYNSLDLVIIRLMRVDEDTALEAPSSGHSQVPMIDRSELEQLDTRPDDNEHKKRPTPGRMSL